jgi:hypothetical protein
MANAKDFRKIALSLEGTVEQEHFDRRAFKARRIFTTLAPDELTANIRFPIEEQEFRVAAQPVAYQPIPNQWGLQGWTIATLANLTPAELRVALTSAWQYQHSAPKKQRR